VTGLAPNTTYYYQVGGSGAWSAEMSFTSNNVGPTVFPFTFGLIADMGEGSAASSTVQHLVDSAPHTDALIFSGDIAYASGCESSGCTTWDAFQRLMSPVAGILPTSVNIGNHETVRVGQEAAATAPSRSTSEIGVEGIPVSSPPATHQLPISLVCPSPPPSPPLPSPPPSSQYDVSAAGQVAVSALHRFAGMPADPTAEGAWYFGYRAGPAHVISVSSFYPGGFGESSKMTAWLQKELASVDRTVTPWLIISLHAPWYNSNSAHQGDGEAMREAYEPIFIAAGVNMIVSGHVHSMERSLPVNNNQLDPKGIVHLNFGDAGAGLYTTWLSPQPKWSAFRSAEWGHAEVTLVNSTHALYTWHRNADPEPTVGDQAYIVNTQTA
jgi:hypothetical protein